MDGAETDLCHIICQKHPPHNRQGLAYKCSKIIRPKNLQPAFQLLEPDINWKLYDLPEYLSALNSAWQYEAATLFRCKYYQNCAHAGYILYMNSAAQSSSDVDRMRQAMRDTKRLGNIRNLFMCAPSGIKILPLSEVATRNDFFNIRKTSRDDLLSEHRVPPQMMGIIPDNLGGFGDAVKAAQVFMNRCRNE